MPQTPIVICHNILFEQEIRALKQPLYCDLKTYTGALSSTLPLPGIYMERCCVERLCVWTC